MPLIRIKSLPFDNDVDVPSMIKRITEDFAHRTDIRLENITVTWEYIPARHYAVAGFLPAAQPQTGSHPILVDVHAPSFHKSDAINVMLECLAFSVSKRSGVAYSNIFISYHKVQSGNLFDRGEIVTWL